MKKFLVPSLLMLFAAGLGQQEAKAGSFSIGISIGDDHRHRPPVVVAPPVIYARPPVVVACPPVVVMQPRRDDCEHGYYVRECEHRHYRGGHGWNDRYRHDDRRGYYRR